MASIDTRSKYGGHLSNPFVRLSFCLCLSDCVSVTVAQKLNGILVWLLDILFSKNNYFSQLHVHVQAQNTGTNQRTALFPVFLIFLCQLICLGKIGCHENSQCTCEQTLPSDTLPQDLHIYPYTMCSKFKHASTNRKTFSKNPHALVNFHLSASN